MEGTTWPTGWPADGGLPPPEAPRAGAPFELNARQLGHRDVAMVAKVYGRFKSSPGATINPQTTHRPRCCWAALSSSRATL